MDFAAKRLVNKTLKIVHSQAQCHWRTCWQIRLFYSTEPQRYRYFNTAASKMEKQYQVIRVQTSIKCKVNPLSVLVHVHPEMGSAPFFILGCTVEVTVQIFFVFDTELRCIVNYVYAGIASGVKGCLIQANLFYSSKYTTKRK